MIFDQYQRYKTVEIIVDMLRTYLQKEKFTILEIGANEQCNLEMVLPKDDIQYSDIELSEWMKEDERFIQLDGCNMSEISDEQYDVVVALDVLEHIPDGQRERFMIEMNRVAKHMAIICFPYKTVYNESAEKRVNSYYKMIFGSDHKWLIEHIQNGLPQLDYVKNILSDNQISHQEFFHGDIFVWEEMMKALFTVYDLQNGGYYFEEIDKLYEEQMYYNDNADLSYRVFMMLSKDECLLQNVSMGLGEKYTSNQSEKVSKLLLRCIDDIKYRLISEQGRKTSVQHQVYYTYDGRFSESFRWTFVSESLDPNIIRVNQTIEIDEKYKALRFDPVEGENCIVKNLLIESDIAEIDFEVLNGIYVNGRIVFYDEDPQIYIDLESHEGIKWIRINAEILRAEFPEAVVRYPINRKIDSSVENLLESANRNGSNIEVIQRLITEYIQKQNEININLNKCNELLSIRTKQCENLQSELAATAEKEVQIRQEKEQWEERCRRQEEVSRQWEERSHQQEEIGRHWEARCAKMESTISWRITGILRKLGKIFQRKEGNSEVGL